MNLKPGDRTEARCTRCNDITGHIIVAIVGGEIIKVQCCACNSVHKYYPATTKKTLHTQPAVRRIAPGADRKATMAATRTPRTTQEDVSPIRQTVASRKAAQASFENEQQWRSAIERPSAPEARPYTLDIILNVGDVVDHSLFGLGVVLSVSKPDKASILFKDDTRNMRCKVV